ncbi:hypothetical protein [Skermanella pratensis]|uniref:hypothetical protein n=1 Tax=Skermanella pratensis TaxID=2233999 RepID=UPI0013011229|nr:hypothetical protein [Skermanella pratensis]
MRKYHATFANFICRFGIKGVLLDYAAEIVLPALSDESLVRTFGPHTSYFIKNYKLTRLGEPDAPVLIASGRFIKNTVLRRTQIYDPSRGLVPDSQTLESAPSAFFALILNNHRLVYFPETPHAPDIPTFEATVKKFISEKYRGFIDKLYKEQAHNLQKITKTQLRKQHAPPTLNIIPLTNEASIEEFIQKFSKLQQIEFELVKPNQEFDGHEIWQELKQYNERLEPDKTFVRTERAEGFDHKEAIKQINDAAASGNQRVRLKGIDADRNRLEGNNESFRVSTKITEVPDTQDGLVARLYQAFTNLLTSGAIRIGSPAEDVTSKIQELEADLG